MDRLFLEADLDQLGHDVFGRRSGRNLGILPQPGKWDTHYLDLHPEVFAESDVAFDHVVHVANLVAEHERWAEMQIALGWSPSYADYLEGVGRRCRQRRCAA